MGAIIDVPQFIVLHFIALCRYCVIFLQMEGLWQSHIKQICWHRFSNRIGSLTSSLCVTLR